MQHSQQESTYGYDNQFSERSYNYTYQFKSKWLKYSICWVCKDVISHHPKQMKVMCRITHLRCMGINKSRKRRKAGYAKLRKY